MCIGTTSDVWWGTMSRRKPSRDVEHAQALRRMARAAKMSPKTFRDAVAAAVAWETAEVTLELEEHLKVVRSRALDEWQPQHDRDADAAAAVGDMARLRWTVAALGELKKYLETLAAADGRLQGLAASNLARLEEERDSPRAYWAFGPRVKDLLGTFRADAADSRSCDQFLTDLVTAAREDFDDAVWDEPG